MKIQIIVDSCCDLTPAIKSTIGIQSAPLKITVGDVEYVDDGTVNIKQLVADMKASKKPLASSCPSPEDYAGLMRQSQESVVVTLSQNLSGSYNAAEIARTMVLEEDPTKKIMVFDSKSASAGELRIVLYIHQLIQEGASFEELCDKVPPFIDGMRTFFVLEDLGNLIKNGRIPRMAGMIGTVLMLRPIMGENGEGEIVSIEKVRGTQNALNRLAEIVAEQTADKPKKSVTLTMSYCNCPERAAEFKKLLLSKSPALGEVMMVPTGALSASYANNGGIIIALS